jgi:hypothetical protein
MIRHDLTSGHVRSIDELAMQTLSAEVFAKMKPSSQEAFWRSDSQGPITT